MSALSSDFCAHDGVDSEELFGYALIEQTHHRRQRFACNLSGGTRSDPTISPIARSTMITTSSFRRPVALLPCGGVPGLARRYSEAAEESVYDGACVSKSSREP